MVCCICMEPGIHDNPLIVLECGCKHSFFHIPCSNEWLGYARTDILPTCPLCRGDVQMKTNYCFSYTAGEEQEFLWNSLAHVPITIYSYFLLVDNNVRFRFLFPLETYLLLAIPFILKNNIRYTNYLYAFRMSTCIELLLGQNVNSFHFVCLLKYTILVYCLYYSYKKRNAFADPLLDYVISREVLFSPAEPVAFSREGNKLRRSVRIANKEGR